MIKLINKERMIVMKAYIHSFEGRPWNEDCEAAYNGLKNLE